MNLLLLNHNLREHGTYFRAFHFGRELARMGHRPTLLTASPNHWYRSAADIIDGVEVIETPSWNPWISRDDGFGPVDIIYRSGLLFRRRWDALYAFAHPPNVLIPHWIWRFLHPGSTKYVAVDWCDLYGGKRGIISGRKRFWAEHEKDAKPPLAIRMVRHPQCAIERWAERHMARRAPKLTVISRFLECAALRWGVAPGRLRRVPSGAPAESIRPLEKSECRAKLGVSQLAGTPVLIYVANYHPDNEFFMESLERAAASGARMRIYVIGPPLYTPVNSRSSVLRDCIVEVGRRPFQEIPLWLGAADLLLLPYPANTFNRSRWPNKIGDYLSAGRPTVTNRTGDFIPLFDKYDIGIASASRPEAYARAIGEAMECPQRWEAWGRNARALAEGSLDWRRLAKELALFWLGDRAEC